MTPSISVSLIKCSDLYYTYIMEFIVHYELVKLILQTFFSQTNSHCGSTWVCKICWYTHKGMSKQVMARFTQ